MRGIYFNGERWWLVCNIRKGKEYHTHVPFDNRKAAQMIVVRADQGRIPESYPDWMVDSINRVWYGKEYKERKDLNNSNLKTNDKEVRFPCEKHNKAKYVNKKRMTR
jgi:hypothetical protein